jgi:hypothetical protein
MSIIKSGFNMRCSDAVFGYYLSGHPHCMIDIHVLSASLDLH